MWKMINDGAVVDDSDGEKYFVATAIIWEYGDNRQVEKIFPNVAAAKKALAEMFAELKADDAKHNWTILPNGTAVSGDNRIYWVVSRDELADNTKFAVVKEVNCMGLEQTEILGFESSEDDAKTFIANLAAKLNDERNSEG